MSNGRRNPGHKLPVEVLLGELARRSEGVFSGDAARSAGVTKNQLSRLTESGFLRRPRARVYVISAFPRTWRQEVSIAHAWSSPYGVLSHRTAAALWGLRNFSEPRPIEVATDRYLRSRTNDVLVHRIGRWLPGDLCRLDHLTATAPSRTLIDLASVLPLEQMRDALDEVLVRELVSLRRLRTRLQNLGGQGRAGYGTLVKLIEEFGGSDLPPQSVLERLYLERSRRAGLPDPETQYEVSVNGRSYRIDFAYPACRVAIELDGWRFHGGRSAWEADARRSNALVAAGWQVIRGTWRDVARNPRILIDQVAELVVPSML